MKHSKLKWSLTVAALAAILIMGGCKKKVAPPPPPPPPPPAPTASLSANPTTIDRGQSTTLTWQTTNATDVTITGVGAVDPSGSRQVSPGQSTSYHLVAKGAGGSADADARVTVNQPVTPVAPQPTVESPSQDRDFATMVKDLYFDYDKYDIRSDAQEAVASTAAFFRKYPNARVTIEGHCDERGSTEYNLALGDNRARAARDAMVQAGVSASQLNPISYGKEKPFCTESNEQCWQSNRRAHFVLGSGSR